MFIYPGFSWRDVLRRTSSAKGWGISVQRVFCSLHVCDKYVLLKRKRTLKSRFCLISFTTIVGWNTRDCHHRKSFKWHLSTWIKWFTLRLSHTTRATACCCGPSVWFPYFPPGGSPQERTKHRQVGKKCEWRNPNPNPGGLRYPQSCVSTGPVPYRAWAHLVSSAPACQGAALTRFAAPWLGHSPSLVWQALAEEDLCLNAG